MVKRLLLK